VFVDATPAPVAAVLRVIYAIDGGPDRLAMGWPLPAVPGSDVQRFAADLPTVAPGSRIDWRPVLSHGRHEIDPGPAVPDAPRQPAQAPVRMPQRFPYDLSFLARVTVPLATDPYAIGMTPDGLRIVFPLGEGGTVRGPLFNGTIDHVGGDWMRIREDGIGVTDIHALIQTDDGATILSEYSGFVDFGPDGQKRMAAHDPPPQANLDLTPRYLTSDPRWDWLNRLQCVGFGRVTMASMLVEYDLYAMQSHATGAQERNEHNV
jgi:hypothetical protein